VSEGGLRKAGKKRGFIKAVEGRVIKGGLKGVLKGGLKKAAFTPKAC
jgi:hypothetical protein